MPGAPPNSIAVSEMASAAPVLLLGTLARVVSAVTAKVNIGPAPLTTTTGSGCRWAVCEVDMPSPAVLRPARRSPAATVRARPISGVSAPAAGAVTAAASGPGSTARPAGVAGARRTVAGRGQRAALAQPERAEYRMRDLAPAGHSGQFHEAGVLRVAAGRHHGEAGLAHTAGTDQGHQLLPGQSVGDQGQFVHPADEAGELGGHRGMGAGRRARI